MPRPMNTPGGTNSVYEAVFGTGEAGGGGG
jgi:hypothetical protein